MTMIWDRLDASGGELNLALSLADHSDDDGESIYPSVARLSHKTRQGERTVRRQLGHFRDTGWLQVVKQGGLVGGRGKTTEYRINPDWIKGAELAGFPDVRSATYADEKGAELAGFPEKGCQTEHERVPSGAVNPATAVAANPSLPIKNPRGAERRAIPAGSPLAPEKKIQDEALSRAWWWNCTRSLAFSLAHHYGVAKHGVTSFDQFPYPERDYVLKKCHDLVARALDAEADIPPVSRRVIEQTINDELVSEFIFIQEASNARKQANGT